jgi:hypothetical protein
MDFQQRKNMRSLPRNRRGARTHKIDAPFFGIAAGMRIAESSLEPAYCPQVFYKRL